MGKKSKKKRQASAKSQSPPQTTKKYTAFINNVLVTMGLLILLYVIYKSVPGYQFVVDRLVLANLKIITENPNITTNQKSEAKLGFDYRYIHYIKQNTPDDAVILMPPDSVFEKSDFNKRGAWGVKTKTWDMYFIYPRTVISEQDSGSYPELYKRITHVMIVNGWGYSKLRYAVQNKQPYTVLPVSQNQDGNSQENQ